MLIDFMRRVFMALMACMLFMANASARLIYNASSYGVVPDTPADMAPLVAQMLEKVKAEAAGKAVTVRFAPGRYHFYPEGAVHKE